MFLLLQPQRLSGLSHQPTQRSRVTARVSFATASPLDRLAGATRMNVLEHADEELQALCSSRSTAEEQAKCWEVGCDALYRQGFQCADQRLGSCVGVVYTSLHAGQLHFLDTARCLPHAPSVLARWSAHMPQGFMMLTRQTAGHEGCDVCRFKEYAGVTDALMHL